MWEPSTETQRSHTSTHPPYLPQQQLQEKCSYPPSPLFLQDSVPNTHQLPYDRHLQPELSSFCLRPSHGYDPSPCAPDSAFYTLHPKLSHVRTGAQFNHDPLLHATPTSSPVPPPASRYNLRMHKSSPSSTPPKPTEYRKGRFKVCVCV